MSGSTWPSLWQCWALVAAKSAQILAGLAKQAPTRTNRTNISTGQDLLPRRELTGPCRLVAEKRLKRPRLGARECRSSLAGDSPAASATEVAASVDEPLQTSGTAHPSLLNALGMPNNARDPRYRPAKPGHHEPVEVGTGGVLAGPARGVHSSAVERRLQASLGGRDVGGPPCRPVFQVIRESSHTRERLGEASEGLLPTRLPGEVMGQRVEPRTSFGGGPGEIGELGKVPQKFHEIYGSASAFLQRPTGPGLASTTPCGLCQWVTGAFVRQADAV